MKKKGEIYERSPGLSPIFGSIFQGTPRRDATRVGIRD